MITRTCTSTARASFTSSSCLHLMHHTLLSSTAINSKCTKCQQVPSFTSLPTTKESTKDSGLLTISSTHRDTASISTCLHSSISTSRDLNSSSSSSREQSPRCHSHCSRQWLSRGIVWSHAKTRRCSSKSTRSQLPRSPSSSRSTGMGTTTPTALSCRMTMASLLTT